MKQEHEGGRGTPLVSSGYPGMQLARALAHANTSNDPQAQERVRRWTDVLMSVLSGSVAPGDRRPVARLPEWVTLEVATGGFATGKAMSAGPLRAHELRLLDELGFAKEAEPRLALNRYFLTDPGLHRLTDALAHDRYEVDVPEEAALLVVAWLLSRDHAQDARALVDALAPYMKELRFYPELTSASRSVAAGVYRDDVRTVLRSLNQIRPNPRVLAQREAVVVWTPLYDRLVALFLETVAGALPVALKDSDGAWQRGPKGQFVVEGGWPCAQYPEGWRQRAQELMAEIRGAAQSNRLCKRASREGKAMERLIHGLGGSLVDPASLSGRDVGRIRLILARYVAKRGVPGMAGMLESRERHLRQASAPSHHDVAVHVGDRLAKYPQSEGLDDIAPVAAPIEPGESQNPFLIHGARVPASIVKKLERCVRGSIDSLVDRGIIPSGEVLAQVLPQLTSGLKSAGITDPNLRTLHASTYRAFRRRRSLLLLNLQKQVQLEELPWVQAMERMRSFTMTDADIAREALMEAAALAIMSFPQAILPNKLVRELVALADAAKMDLPLTEELAADIFMGEFSPKFAEAARRSTKALRGTLYARYYGIDSDQVLAALEQSRAEDRVHRRPDALAKLCAARAGVNLGTYRPATNGRIIEQQLILTTHNLSALIEMPGMRGRLADRFDAMARRCFQWIVEHLQLPEEGFHVGLVRVKNAAYAWRQMVFFLSQRSDDPQNFVSWARSFLGDQPDSFVNRFEPAMRGLEAALTLTRCTQPPDPKAFVGWIDGRHWLLSPITDLSR
jgi:hypothetical protein